MDKFVLLSTALFAVVLGILLLAAQTATMPTENFLQGQDLEPEQNLDNAQEPSPNSTQRAGLEPEPIQVCFPNTCINAELAETPEKRRQGLMYREQLGAGEGMLFVFETEAVYGFWMKNTLIPLDIIWLDSSKKVVHIETAVPCTTERCISYTPSAAALYVVEANAGFAEENGIEIGTPVEFEG